MIAESITSPGRAAEQGSTSTTVDHALWEAASDIESAAYKLAATERMVRMILAINEVDVAALYALSGLIRDQADELLRVSNTAYAACGAKDDAAVAGSVQ